MALACNLCYSGYRDQKDFGSKPAQVNNSMRPHLKKKKKNLITGKGWWSVQGVGPEFKPHYYKKKSASSLKILYLECLGREVFWISYFFNFIIFACI
jgi:hypothetical protein